MKTPIKNPINRFGVLVLLAVFIWTVTSCATSHSDPLAGWKPDFNSRLGGQAIEKDYHDYIQKLPPKERERAGPINRFEDGTGRHAVVINIDINGISWKHVLIYDKNIKRIRTIKYFAGNYAS